MVAYVSTETKESKGVRHFPTTQVKVALPISLYLKGDPARDRCSWLYEGGPRVGNK